VIVGNNDAHAKNVAIVHTPLGPHLADIYDALPNLFQEELINYNMALSIDSTFDHRRMSVERLQREAESWRILPAEKLAASIDECLVRVHAALAEVEPPKGISRGLAERLMLNASRLIEGSEIGSPR
jgi:serine/threonine-protein kinase HipA